MKRIILQHVGEKFIRLRVLVSTLWGRPWCRNEFDTPDINHHFLNALAFSVTFKLKVMRLMCCVFVLSSYRQAYWTWSSSWGSSSSPRRRCRCACSTTATTRRRSSKRSGTTRRPPSSWTPTPPCRTSFWNGSVRLLVIHAHRDMEVASGTENGSSGWCQRRTISGSTKNLSNQSSLNKHFLK